MKENNNVNTFNSYDSIKIAKAVSNIDYFYGPYESIEQANSNIPKSYRKQGRTVGIINSQKGIDEYWYKEGIEDNHLVIKTQDVFIPEFSEDDQGKVLKIGKEGLSWEFENTKAIEVVQDTGYNKDKVMSQKAVTELFEKGYRFYGVITGESEITSIPNTYQLIIKQGIYRELEINTYCYILYDGTSYDIVDIKIPFSILSAENIKNEGGNSTTDVLSQKYITDRFSEIIASIPNIQVTQSLGNSEEHVMSQKAVTNNIYETSNILVFDGFIETANIKLANTTSLLGKVYYVLDKQTFAYYVEEENIYYALWPEYRKYLRIQSGKRIPKDTVIYRYADNLFIFKETLILKSDEIPSFQGIVTEIPVLNNLCPSVTGKVVFFKTDEENNKGIFVYSYNDLYYSKWYNMNLYQNVETGKPLENKIFIMDNQEYIYSNDSLTLISDLNKITWKTF